MTAHLIFLTKTEVHNLKALFDGAKEMKATKERIIPSCETMSPEFFEFSRAIKKVCSCAVLLEKLERRLKE